MWPQIMPILATACFMDAAATHSMNSHCQADTIHARIDLSLCHCLHNWSGQTSNSYNHYILVWPHETTFYVLVTEYSEIEIW